MSLKRCLVLTMGAFVLTLGTTACAADPQETASTAVTADPSSTQSPEPTLTTAAATPTTSTSSKPASKPSTSSTPASASITQACATVVAANDAATNAVAGPIAAVMSDDQATVVAAAHDLAAAFRTLATAYRKAAGQTSNAQLKSGLNGAAAFLDNHADAILAAGNDVAEIRRVEAQVEAGPSTEIVQALNLCES